MTLDLSGVRSPSQQEKVMSTEQFEQIVRAILEGKYSWACVLILRFSGYNPVHYIPYRTYKRLIRDNRAIAKGSRYNLNSTGLESQELDPVRS